MFASHHQISLGFIAFSSSIIATADLGFDQLFGTIVGGALSKT